MKADRRVSRKTLFTADEVARAAKVDGRGRMMTVDGAERLAVETNSRVSLKLAKGDLSAYNVLVVNLLLPEPFDGSLVTTVRCSTQSPGVETRDSYFSVLHFNQPETWRGWQRLIMPAVNLVATGFPNGWKDIETIELDLHSRHSKGWVVVGGVEVERAEKPAGPRMTDEELLAALDMEWSGLGMVKRWAGRHDTRRAIAAYARYLRRHHRPPMAPPRENKHWTASSADDLCRNIVMEQHLPQKLDWHVNPIGYMEWNHAFNRHGWMGVLAEAWKRTKQLKYARKLDYFMRTWIEQNPEPVGHNGGLDPAWETLSTSCRINWAWGYVLEVARESRGISDRTLVDMAKMVYAHAEHLSRYWGHNNWFISESTAILTSASYFPEFLRADDWFRLAIKRLEAEMQRQVFADGVQFELSPGYHMMCADLLYLAWSRGKFRRRRFSPEYERRLWSMYDFQARITRPDGTYPVPNDAGGALPKGNARLLEVGRERRRKDWIWAGTGGEEERPPEVGSVHFADAGYAVMRSGWTHDDRWAFIDMAEFGASHQHEDKLSVEFYAYGSPFIVDPGISSYQPDPVVKHFRMSDGHNTVNIDGLGQWRRRTGEFRRYESSSRGKNVWASGRGLDYAEGKYDEAYGATGDRPTRPSEAPSQRTAVLEGITHRRALVFVRPDYWLVLDSVLGSGVHEAEAMWHFLPMHVRVDEETAIVRTNRLGHANLELICRGDWAKAEFELVTAREKPVQGFMALDREVKPATCAIVSRRMKLPLHGVTVVAPFATGSESHYRVTTEAIEGRSGAGLLIVVDRPAPEGEGRMVDRFLWRHTGKGMLVAEGMRSDGRLALVRTGPTGKVRYAGIVGGTMLRAGAVEVSGREGGLGEKVIRGTRI